MAAAEKVTRGTALEAARRHVAERWPDLAEAEPKVSRRQRRSNTTSKSAQLAGSAEPVVEYVVTFTKAVETPDGHALRRTARIVVGADGSVVKATTSK